MRNAGTKPKSNERSSEPSALVRAAAVTKAADVCTPFESRDVSPPAPPTRVACKPASGPTRLITIVYSVSAVVPVAVAAVSPLVNS